MFRFWNIKGFMGTQSTLVTQGVGLTSEWSDSDPTPKPTSTHVDTSHVFQPQLKSPGNAAK